MPRTIIDAQRILSAVLLRGSRPLTAQSVLREQYAGFMRMMGFPISGPPPIIGVGIYAREETAERELGILLADEHMASATGKLIEHFGLSEFKIQQIVTGPIFASARPAQGGDSLGYGTSVGATGTFGCLVKNAAGDTFILSCNHVIAAVNSGVRRVDTVWQPGPADGGGTTDKIGVLHDFKDIDFSGTTPNDIDAAIAKPDSSSNVSSGVRGLGSINGSESDPLYGTDVQMQGWLTGKSNGTLNYKKFSFLLSFPGYGEALFENQYGINSKTSTNFAQQGDSGAIVLDDQNRAVGLVIGVASQIDLAFVNPIDPILTYFSIEIA